MRRITVLILFAAALVLGGCSSKFKTYNGPEVTRVVVLKGERRMYLLHHQKVLSTYAFGLGFQPTGDKKFEGDGRTPEGEYVIDRRNPNSKFHLSIGINYPREEDIKEALEMGRAPGGDIFIHGEPNEKKRFAAMQGDWTAGCIAVRNKDIEMIYAMVKDGTPISIYP